MLILGPDPHLPNQNPCFKKIPKSFMCTPKFENAVLEKFAVSWHEW